MIAEENLSNKNNPNISVSSSIVILLIKELMVDTIPYFKSYLISGFHKKKKLNEEDLTQLFTKQAQILIRKNDYPFNIEGEYKDVYNLSKGFSDFFFYPNEQNVSTASIFSVESKRLPSPSKSREKEYVIGAKNNGGIERYKTEKHGMGLFECGLLGFIEQENSKHWLKEINNWIEDLSKVDKNWNQDEILSEIESKADFCTLQSMAHRKNDDINLHHLWVKLN